MVALHRYEVSNKKVRSPRLIQYSRASACDMSEAMLKFRPPAAIVKTIGQMSGQSRAVASLMTRIL